MILLDFGERLPVVPACSRMKGFSTKVLPVAREHGPVAREHESGCPGAQLSITGHIYDSSAIAREHGISFYKIYLIRS